MASQSSPVLTDFSHEILCHILQYLPLTKVLSISMLCKKLLAAVDMHLRLRKEIDFCEGKIYDFMPATITDDHMHALLKKCPHLEAVLGLHPLKVERRRLRKRSALTVPGIIEALSLCCNLKSIETSDLRLLEAIMHHLPQVDIVGHFRNRGGEFPPQASQRLKLQPYPRISSLHLVGVEVPELTAMPHLEHLHLICVRFSKLQPFRAFLAQNLKTFVMKHCMGPLLSLRYLSLIIALSSSPSLSRLELVRVPLPGGLFQRAVEDSYRHNGFVNLKTLVISGCKGVLESDLGHLMIVSSKNLESISIQPSLTRDSLFVSLSFAQCEFPKLKSLHLGFVDKLDSSGFYSNDALVSMGLAEVPDTPSSLTDSGMKVISQLFPNITSMSVSNCPHLMAMDQWSAIDGEQVWKELTDLTLQRCHCLQLPSFALFLAFLPKIEVVILNDMFREPPKGCSHVGLSAGTGLGMSSAVVSNQDEHIAVQGHPQGFELQPDDHDDFIELDNEENPDQHIMVLQQEFFDEENQIARAPEREDIVPVENVPENQIRRELNRDYRERSNSSSPLSSSEDEDRRLTRKRVLKGRRRKVSRKKRRTTRRNACVSSSDENEIVLNDEVRPPRKGKVKMEQDGLKEHELVEFLGGSGSSLEGEHNVGKQRCYGKQCQNKCSKGFDPNKPSTSKDGNCLDCRCVGAELEKPLGAEGKALKRSRMSSPSDCGEPEKKKSIVERDATAVGCYSPDLNTDKPEGKKADEEVEKFKGPITRNRSKVLNSKAKEPAVSKSKAELSREKSAPSQFFKNKRSNRATRVFPVKKEIPSLSDKAKGGEVTGMVFDFPAITIKSEPESIPSSPGESPMDVDDFHPINVQSNKIIDCDSHFETKSGHKCVSSQKDTVDTPYKAMECNHHSISCDEKDDVLGIPEERMEYCKTNDPNLDSAISDIMESICESVSSQVEYVFDSIKTMDNCGECENPSPSIPRATENNECQSSVNQIFTCDPSDKTESTTSISHGETFENETTECSRTSGPKDGCDSTNSHKLDTGSSRIETANMHESVKCNANNQNTSHEIPPEGKSDYESVTTLCGTEHFTESPSKIFTDTLESSEFNKTNDTITGSDLPPQAESEASNEVISEVELELSSHIATADLELSTKPSDKEIKLKSSECNETNDRSTNCKVSLETQLEPNAVHVDLDIKLASSNSKPGSSIEVGTKSSHTKTENSLESIGVDQVNDLYSSFEEFLGTEAKFITASDMEGGTNSSNIKTINRLESTVCTYDQSTSSKVSMGAPSESNPVLTDLDLELDSKSSHEKTPDTLESIECNEANDPNTNSDLPSKPESCTDSAQETIVIDDVSVEGYKSNDHNYCSLDTEIKSEPESEPSDTPKESQDVKNSRIISLGEDSGIKIELGSPPPSPGPDRIPHSPRYLYPLEVIKREDESPNETSSNANDYYEDGDDDNDSEPEPPPRREVHTRIIDCHCCFEIKSECESANSSPENDSSVVKEGENSCTRCAKVKSEEMAGASCRTKGKRNDKAEKGKKTLLPRKRNPPRICKRARPPLTRSQRRQIGGTDYNFVNQGTQATSADIRRSLRRLRSCSKKSESNGSRSNSVSSRQMIKRTTQTKSNVLTHNKCTSTSDPLMEDDAVQTLRLVSETLISLTIISCGISDVVIDHCHSLTHVEVQACRILKMFQLHYSPALKRIGINECPKLTLESLTPEVGSLVATRKLLIFYEPCMQKYSFSRCEKAIFSKTPSDQGVVLFYDYTSYTNESIQAAYKEYLLKWMEIVQKLYYSSLLAKNKKKRIRVKDIKSKYPYGHCLRRIHGSSLLPRSVDPFGTTWRYQILTNDHMFASALEKVSWEEGFPAPDVAEDYREDNALLSMIETELTEKNWKTQKKLTTYYIPAQENSFS